MDRDALFQLGMDLDLPSTAQTEDYRPEPAGAEAAEERKDFFVVKHGVRCAGTHLIIDLYGAKKLDDLAHIDAALRRCVDAAGATLLHIHLHHFTPNGGVSGVAVLAESHISIHSWPEADYAAFDVFMCGQARPEATVEVLREAFAPDRVVVSEMLRGRGAA
ncbi:MAG: adenosylmethionine decarboxylase [Pseudomonadota bacterium]|nr:adenosylmethionine decarboxylase [Pseudomonadota bacterium]